MAWSPSRVCQMWLPRFCISGMFLSVTVSRHLSDSVSWMLSFLSLFLNSWLHQALLCDLTCLILCFPSPRQQKKQSILLAFTLLFALLFTLSMFVRGNGGLCTWMVLLLSVLRCEKWLRLFKCFICRCCANVFACCSRMLLLWHL